MGHGGTTQVASDPFCTFAFTVCAKVPLLSMHDIGGLNPSPCKTSPALQFQCANSLPLSLEASAFQGPRLVSG